jgi:hypothetical protein
VRKAILKDRAEKFGRNLMAAGGVILVLAWVPGIDLKGFEPLGFKFKPGSDAEFSLWCLLAGILVYYGVRFAILAAVDFTGKDPSFKPTVMPRSWWNINGIIPERLAYAIEKMQFYIFDIIIPLFVTIAAFATVVWKIGALWP